LGLEPTTDALKGRRLYSAAERLLLILLLFSADFLYSGSRERKRQRGSPQNLLGLASISFLGFDKPEFPRPAIRIPLKILGAIRLEVLPDNATQAAIDRCHASIESPTHYAHEHFEDPPEMRDWIWPDAKV
jgi:hypothetical protein